MRPNKHHGLRCPVCGRCAHSRTAGFTCSRTREGIASTNGVNFNASWWAFGHCTDRADFVAEAVGLEELKLKNRTTDKEAEILANEG